MKSDCICRLRSVFIDANFTITMGVCIRSVNLQAEHYSAMSKTGFSLVTRDDTKEMDMWARQAEALLRNISAWIY